MNGITGKDNYDFLGSEIFKISKIKMHWWKNLVGISDTLNKNRHQFFIG